MGLKNKSYYFKIKTYSYKEINNKTKMIKGKTTPSFKINMKKRKIKKIQLNSRNIGTYLYGNLCFFDSLSSGLSGFNLNFGKTFSKNTYFYTKPVYSYGIVKKNHKKKMMKYIKRYCSNKLSKKLYKFCNYSFVKGKLYVKYQGTGAESTYLNSIKILSHKKNKYKIKCKTQGVGNTWYDTYRILYKKGKFIVLKKI